MAGGTTVTFKGIRRWFNLETKDLSQAIERKQELLDSPSLARHDSLEVDCARFVNWKLARREYTSGSAEKARHVLKDFSSRFGDRRDASHDPHFGHSEVV